MQILGAALFLAMLAGFLSVVLVVVSRKFAVEENPLIAEVAEALPQYNCGACGFPGCSGFAKFLVETRSPDAVCIPGGPEIQKKLAGIMGMETVESVPMVAHIFCKGSNQQAINEGEYFGIQDCIAADLVNTGTKACPFGCLGLGSCVDACQFEAIVIKDGIAEILDDKCVSCGQCVKACPRGLIRMIPKGARVAVECSSKDKGAPVKKACKVGCITCQLCVKSCPEKAISLVNDVIVIDHALCKLCGICIEKCPQNCILPAHWDYVPPVVEATGEREGSA